MVSGIISSLGLEWGTPSSGTPLSAGSMHQTSNTAGRSVHKCLGIPLSDPILNFAHLVHHRCQGFSRRRLQAMEADGLISTIARGRLVFQTLVLLSYTLSLKLRCELPLAITAHYHTVPGKNSVCPSNAIGHSPDGALLGGGWESPRSYPGSPSLTSTKAWQRTAWQATMSWESTSLVFSKGHAGHLSRPRRAETTSKKPVGLCGEALHGARRNRSAFVSSSGGETAAKKVAWLRAEWASTQGKPTRAASEQRQQI
jgi:hypothetical protein